MANATMSKDEILDAIGSMSVLELSELVEAFKSKFNVTISAAPVGAAPAAIGLHAASPANCNCAGLLLRRTLPSPTPLFRLPLAVTLTSTDMTQYSLPSTRKTETLMSLPSGPAKISRTTAAGLFAPVGDPCPN